MIVISLLIISLLLFILLAIYSGGLSVFTERGKGHGLLIGTSLLIPLLALVLYLPQGLSLGAGFDMALSEQVTNLESAQTELQRVEYLHSIEKILVPLLDQSAPADRHLQLLAETYSSLNLHSSAVSVYERLEQRYPSDAMTLTLLAQAMYLAMNSQADLTPDDFSNENKRVTLILDRALNVEPDFALALSLRGMQSFQIKDYQQAVSFWNSALTRYQPSSAEALSLKKGIQLARSKLSQSIQTDDALTAIIRLRIELGPNLDHSGIDSLTPVFIFARDKKGGMPLAAKKIRVDDLPMNVTLTENDRMAAVGLIAQRQVVVAARLALSGQAILQKGDLQSQELIVSVASAFDDAPIHTLTIDH
tara:strand:- start:5 stop:1093 length:1089 start_codon:yes stop_codon:yes gene_type:complete